MITLIMLKEINVVLDEKSQRILEELKKEWKMTNNNAVNYIIQLFKDPKFRKE